MRAEVPQHAHVFLKQPQVHAGGLDVVDRPDQARVDQFFNLTHGGTEHERVADHQRAPVGRGEPRQILGLVDRRRQRFFHQHVLARIQCPFDQGVVSAHGC